MYAIVDIETTGGHASSNGITDICIIVFDGERIVDQFQSLVNPEKEIPRYIESLTGISNEMVAKAPVFASVAEKVFTMLEHQIFVAHNVNFDYSFVKYSLAQCGFDLNAKKLCTVRLSRKILPNYPSYSLGNLCGYLNIKVNDRHRAQGDAEATVKLFGLLLKNDADDEINKMLKRNSKEQVLPPNLPKQQFEKLPKKPGVYYFHDQDTKIVYVGKAIDIKARVSSHFSNNSVSKQKQHFLRDIYSISFEETATELMALILESHEIKHYWPKYNKAQKQYEPKYGLYDYTDRLGVIRFGIELITKHRHSRPIMMFATKISAIEELQRQVIAFDLCMVLSGIQLVCENRVCACKKTEDVLEYNARANDFIEKNSVSESFLIIDKGKTKGEYSAIWVNKGKFTAMGYVPKKIKPNDIDEVVSYLKLFKENFFILKQIIQFANENPEKVVWMEE
jgi:DNA polymerase-3 subunit epsilon